MAANDTVKVKVTADASQFKKEMKKVDGTLKKSQENASKMGGAVSGLGSALGGALPAQTGAAVSALGNLLDVVIAGGPLALGIAGLVAGAGFLVKDFLDAKESLKEFEAQAKTSAAAIQSLTLELDLLGLAGADREIAKIERELAKLASTADIEAGQGKADKSMLERIFGAMPGPEGERGLFEKKRIDAEVAATGAVRENLEGQLSAVKQLRDEQAKIAEERRKDAEAMKAAQEAQKRRAKAVADNAKEVAGLVELEWMLLEPMTEAVDLEQARHDIMLAEFDMLEAELDLIAERDAAVEKAMAEKAKADAERHAARLAMQRDEAEAWGGFAADQLTFALDLATQERLSQDEILKAVLERIRAEAWARGVTLAIEGASALALGQPGGGVALGGGLTLMGIGAGAAFAAANITPSGATGPTTAIATSAPTGSVGPGQAASTQETTITNYVFNGPAFGMAEDDTARTITRLNARGSRLEGRG